MPKAKASELDALASEPKSPGEASLLQPFGKDTKGEPVFEETPPVEPPEMTEEAKAFFFDQEKSVRTDNQEAQPADGLTFFPAPLAALAATAALNGVGFAYDHRSGAQAALLNAQGVVRLVKYNPNGDDERWFVKIPAELPLIIVPAPPE